MLGVSVSLHTAEIAALSHIETTGRDVDVLRLYLEARISVTFAPGNHRLEECCAKASTPRSRRDPDVPQSRCIIAAPKKVHASHVSKDAGAANAPLAFKRCKETRCWRRPPEPSQRGHSIQTRIGVVILNVGRIYRFLHESDSTYAAVN